MNKLFGINGILGLLIAVVLLLVVVFLLGYQGIMIQKEQASNYYTIDRSAVEMKSVDNIQYYKLKDK
ncbi:DUF4006 family protein [Helicobacter sp. faydin-H20]|uniref:DUF4006 family protein n=1 Tax=Helicobacter anatolicus TaxID=2905874 RepID=UPI001E41C82E|nr:DUF4006 family protein [Helicobacter anatolicus]MCE3037374.1 DUF4006 family protein [Helicobacter anatolicus]